MIEYINSFTLFEVLFFLSFSFLVVISRLLFSTVLIWVFRIVLKAKFDLIEDSKQLLHIFVLKVVLIETHFCLEYLRVDLLELAKDLDQVKAGSLTKPIEMFLFIKLLLCSFDFVDTCLAEVVLTLANFNDLFIKSS